MFFRDEYYSFFWHAIFENHRRLAISLHHYIIVLVITRQKLTQYIKVEHHAMQVQHNQMKHISELTGVQNPPTVEHLNLVKIPQCSLLNHVCDSICHLVNRTCAKKIYRVINILLLCVYCSIFLVYHVHILELQVSVVYRSGKVSPEIIT